MRYMANPASRVWILPVVKVVYLISDRPEVVIKRNTPIEVVPTIDSLLALDTKLERAKRLIHIDAEKFVLIWHNFCRLFQDNVYLFLNCFPPWAIKPVIPVFDSFPGTNHQVERRIFN